MKKSIDPPVFRPSQSERRVASARRIMYHKRRAGRLRTVQDRPSRRPRLGRLRVRELEVRERLLEVADDRLVDAALAEHRARARAAPRSRAAPARGRAPPATTRAEAERRDRRERRAGGGRRPSTLSSCVDGAPPRSASLPLVSHRSSPSLAPARRRSPRASRPPRSARSAARPRSRSGTARNGAAPISSATGSTHSISSSIRCARRDARRRARSRSARPRGRSGSRARGSPRSAGAGRLGQRLALVVARARSARRAT